MQDSAVAVVKLGAELLPGWLIDAGCTIEKIDAFIKRGIHVGSPEDSKKSPDKFIFPGDASKGEIEMT